MDFEDINNENDPATCRGRAVHARLAARETSDQDFRRIFERLAQLYDSKAETLERRRERAERQTNSASSEDLSESSHMRDEADPRASGQVED